MEAKKDQKEKPGAKKKYNLRTIDGQLLIGNYSENTGWLDVVVIKNYKLKYKESKGFYILKCYQDRWKSLVNLAELFSILSELGSRERNFLDFDPIIELIEKNGYTKL